MAEMVIDYNNAQKERELYPLEKKGVFRVMGGTREEISRREIGFYQGRFIDVVAYATQLREFYCHYGSKALGSQNHGYIEKIEMKKIDVLSKNLATILNQQDNVLKEKERLDKLLKDGK